MLASGSGDRTVRLWDVGTAHHQQITEHGDWVTAVAFSPDGRTLVTTAGTVMKLWHIPTRREVGTLNYGTGYLAFSSDGTLLLLANLGGGAQLLRAPHPPDAVPP